MHIISNYIEPQNKSPVSIFLFYLKLKYQKYIFVIMYWKENKKRIFTLSVACIKDASSVLMNMILNTKYSYLNTLWYISLQTEHVFFAR